MSRKTLSLILFVASVLLVVLAVVTLAPYPSRMVSDLGYQSLCTFAPYSTITLLLLAGLGWAVRRHVDSLPAA